MSESREVGRRLPAKVCIPQNFFYLLGEETNQDVVFFHYITLRVVSDYIGDNEGVFKISDISPVNSIISNGS
jgi:hypothetical protein